MIYFKPVDLSAGLLPAASPIMEDGSYNNIKTFNTQEHKT